MSIIFRLFVVSILIVGILSSACGMATHKEVLSVITRLATIDDCATIAGIHHELWHKTYTFLSERYRSTITHVTWTQFWADFFTRADGSFMFVAECDDQIVGFIAAGPVEVVHIVAQGYDAEIYKFYVKQEYQKRGLGLQLIAACRKKLAELGKKKILFQSFEQNDKANKLYDALGAVIIARHTADMGGIAHGRIYKIPE